MPTEAYVLGIDTSTVATVGLARGGTVLGRATAPDRMKHAEHLIGLLDQVCADAGIDPRDRKLERRLVIGVGPGPFTGLRVGIITARTLGLTLGIEVRGVCSLDVLAAQAVAEAGPAGEFVIATDARRREVYWARYDASGRRLTGPEVGSPDRVPDLPCYGPATAVYRDRLNGAGPELILDGGTLAASGLGLPDVGLEPLYLRRPDAVEPSRPKSVLAANRRRS
ncbi:tRNA (adenosine(37)-N6)-threonylcarbamoyltransferase complex dimerization subunit type 1 TsaB [Microlunatus parietis]|uniref:tRNA threonylcarbamoyl adenosine modification protein YeaZ n=1 Tax=Microlunatus parietis TaxID=682979 RepID=A0A7Y9I668_9ACTN|nr:tRNA (adenosine(37)-N6)-threonylcarbamoyltransferase complex dimerization subunit type 1 TsaB [Microlunatus parietis]NYE71028.1 tRNA threonylcarbamoyl adenosine modification protein YeaZ [Microlunatus parietis]